MFDPGLKPGEVIDNETLTHIFRCGPQGGMRKSNRTNTLVLISNHVKSIYDDRWVADRTIHYTGMGQKGDQDINFSQNKTLAKSRTNGIDVHLFEVFKPKEYTYVGRVELSGDSYQENQVDENGELRKVWVFPLKLADSEQAILPEEEILEVYEKKLRKAKKLDEQKLMERIKTSHKKPGKRLTNTSVYERNPYVAAMALKRAKGICQLCQQPAPFSKRNGEPYLEVHHIVWLSKGGEDSLENTVALCPNCHRKMHVLDLEDDKKILFKEVSFSIG